ncbi:MAG: UMP kinase [Chlamydiales bacterium]|nr:UMP kinase [Chlamydiales bacterium]
MQQTRSNQRILIKLSGESLSSSKDSASSFDSQEMESIASKIVSLSQKGYELAIVIGGGNILRGREIQENIEMPKVASDSMGMLATVINAIALSQTLKKLGCKNKVFTSFSLDLPYTEFFKANLAQQALETGHICLFAGGTGSPFFTTDSCAALRACEIGADLLVKVTTVDGIYSEDPKINPQATRFEKISYTDCINKQLKVMDSTAFALCRDNKIPLVICHLKSIVDAIVKEKNRTLVQGD